MVLEAFPIFVKIKFYHKKSREYLNRFSSFIYLKVISGICMNSFWGIQSSNS